MARFVALDFDATGNRGRTFDKPLGREFPEVIEDFARFCPAPAMDCDFSLTPPGTYDSLRLPGIGQEIGNFSRFRTVLVVNAAGATQVEVAVVDSPKALPRGE